MSYKTEFNEKRINQIFMNGYRFGWTDIEIISAIVRGFGLPYTLENCMAINQYNPVK